MGKKQGSNTSTFADIVLNEDHLASIKRIVKEKIKIERTKKESETQIKEDIDALASQLNVKAAEINKIVNIILKENKDQGHISKESHILDIAQQVLD